ncbi:hypothetical protein BRADI_5g14160v3 [Brachypodium distachyon]|uniref:Ribosome-recycling factor, chloroplastic n=1 Tax=Brachypodium distachyon TaxID=15368 RepID=A0A0Q3E687_BRADI|nr:hypothetical protein BRADI_5g14160v3 [Brachypodium distachyon]
MALLLRRGATLAARSLRVAAAASSASTSVHRLTAAGSLGAARELPSTQIFLFEARRGFAKGKKSKNDSRGDTVEAVPDIGPTVKSTATAQMETAVVALSRELSKLRTGRASPGMLDHIMVETADTKVGLNRIAVVSVLDAHTLSVMPYDPSSMKSIENAIVSSPLGINPTPDGNRIIAPIPPLTKENIQALCKVVTKSAEDFKQSIRRARQKVEEMTKKFIKSADDMCKAKEKEISGN